MRFRRGRSLLFFLLFLIPGQISFGKCPEKGTALLLFPLKTAKGSAAGAPSLVVPVLLKEYLALVKGLRLLSIPETAAATFDPKAAAKKGKELGAERLLIGNLMPDGKGFRLESLLLSPDGTEIARLKGSFEFPSSLNDLLVAWTGQITGLLGGKKMKEKKILPYLNITSSAEAYLAYAQGQVALERGLFEEAVRSFDEAIRRDYNYAAAYLGLAEALAAEGGPWQTKARVEWEKAKLLNPVLAKIRESRIEGYLKGKKADSCDGR